MMVMLKACAESGGGPHLERQYQPSLVNIPIAFYPTTREEKIRFRQLRRPERDPVPEGR
jgi:hypothetical protein